MRPTVMRIESAPEFASLVNDELLSRYRMPIELGRVKTRTKTQWQRKLFGNSKAKSPIINHKVAPQWPSLLQYSIPAARPIHQRTDASVRSQAHNRTTFTKTHEPHTQRAIQESWLYRWSPSHPLVSAIWYRGNPGNMGELTFRCLSHPHFAHWGNSLLRIDQTHQHTTGHGIVLLLTLLFLINTDYPVLAAKFPFYPYIWVKWDCM